MPWTIAHAAAALPLRSIAQGRLSLAALVVGSMTPDLGYYVWGFGFAGLAHSPAGLFVVCLPSGLVLLAIIRWLRDPVCRLLPEPHRTAIATLPRIPLYQSAASMANVALSLLLGAASHIVWDSFTHANGWAVAALPVLRTMIQYWPDRAVPLYHLLQHLSTALGAGVLIFAYSRWLANAVGPRREHRDIGERWRYALLATIFLVSAVVAVAVAYGLSLSSSGRLRLQPFVFRSTVFATTAFLSLLVVSSLLAEWRSRRSQSSCAELP